MKILFLIHDYTIDPLGIGYLSAELKAQGHETAILKTKDGVSDEDMLEIHPDVLAYSVTTGWHQYYLELNRELKERFPDMVSVFGGPHATFFQDMVDEDGVDLLIQGEAETLLPEALKRIRMGLPIKDGILFRATTINQDLDSIEFPDRDLMYSYPENRNNPIKNVMLSRGCPYACTYCYNGTYKKMFKGQKTLRYRSVDNVLDECIALKRDYPETKFIFFQDDEFICHKGRLKEFTKKYPDAVGLPFHCQLRAELVTPAKVEMLVNAGCVSVTFAAEAGNDLIRTEMLKRQMSKDDIRNAARILQEGGLQYRIENMVGLPGETIDEALETLDLNIECKPAVAFCSLFQPYPKTPLGDLCEKLLIWDGDVDSIGQSFFDASTIKRDTTKEFNNLQKWFGLVVEFPRLLRPFIKLLIKLPRTRVLARVSTWWRRRCYARRLYNVRGK